MGTVDTIKLDADARDTLLAALAVYCECGYGDPAQRPDWVKNLACPNGDSTSLVHSGIRELFEHLLSTRNAVTFNGPEPSFPSLVETAKNWELQFFVVPEPTSGIPVVTFHEELSEALARAKLVHGIAYSTTLMGLPPEGYCVVGDCSADAL